MKTDQLKDAMDAENLVLSRLSAPTVTSQRLRIHLIWALHKFGFVYLPRWLLYSELVLKMFLVLLLPAVVLVIQSQVIHSTLFCSNKVQYLKRRLYRCLSLMVYVWERISGQSIRVEGREFKTSLIVLPDAKINSTLLGIDFLQKAKIVLKSFWK